jgi:hypothetical protein
VTSSVETTAARAVNSVPSAGRLRRPAGLCHLALRFAKMSQTPADELVDSVAGCAGSLFVLTGWTAAPARGSLPPVIRRRRPAGTLAAVIGRDLR